MTPQQFRRLALGCVGAVEASHMGHPDFRIGGKIFASLGSPDESFATVRLTPDQQAGLMAAAPDVFVPSSGAWGRSGWTTIRLAKAKVSLARSAIELAFETVAAAAPKKRRKSP